ncbi:MAG TPA: phenylalanine--tRNA ligase subunit beta, partial [Polyangia bacterium]|nr:phenylalanine--tRNA ligase subunit beta [Polyangia bacterium]
FDLDKLEGGIVVRRARAGETIETLDGVNRSLVPDDIVIADARGPVALAGVMGGARTEVSATTVNVLLEAATFDPRSVRKTAKRFGLHSEASHRFERGVDADGVPVAAARAAAMLAGLGGGTIVAAPVERASAPPAPRTIALGLTTLRRTAGFDLPAEEALAKLRGIEFVATVEGDAICATVPSFRPDVTIAEDLVEEVMRLVGLDRVPARLPQGGKAPDTSPERLPDRARDTLAALGLHEIAGWAFVPRAALAALGEPALAAGITVSNPISADYEVMRTSLLPGLADAARRNLARGVADVRLFEVGPVVAPVAGDEHHRQSNHAAGLMLGRRAGWLKPGAPLDFFDLKQVVTELLASLGQRAARFAVPGPGSIPAFLHPGIVASVEISVGDGWQRLGLAGELHPAMAGRLGLEGTALYFELALDALAAGTATVRIAPPPRFPTVTRDVSFWIDATVSAAAQEAAMRAAGVQLLQELAVLEDFRDARFVPAGKKGMLWTMVYRSPERTLTDVEVDTAHGHVVAALRQAFSVELR